MMKKNYLPAEDDGHTIVDMSALERTPAWLPRPRRGVESGQSGSPDRGEPLLTREERLWCIMGTLKAALLIAGVYLLGIGAVIALFLML